MMVFFLFISADIIDNDEIKILKSQWMGKRKSSSTLILSFHSKYCTGVLREEKLSSLMKNRTNPHSTGHFNMTVIFINKTTLSFILVLLYFPSDVCRTNYKMSFIGNLITCFFSRQPNLEYTTNVRIENVKCIIY